jgi:hypothetical protein
VLDILLSNTMAVIDARSPATAHHGVQGGFCVEALVDFTKVSGTATTALPPAGGANFAPCAAAFTQLSVLLRLPSGASFTSLTLPWASKRSLLAQVRIVSRPSDGF